MRTSSEGKMPDGRAVLISRKVQKQASRAKEKILQNLGKADKTTDEIFDDYVHNFNKQANSATRLQKEVNNYVRCVRAMQAASKSLFDQINEMYELEWTDRDVLVIQSQNLEMLWADFSQKLIEQVAAPLSHHMAQFPEYRSKIEKRGRKLLDYDSNRHALEALQSNPKKRDDGKIGKVREQLEDSRRNYETLNWELHQELPALYDSRIPFLVSNFQTICAAEALFHSECAKVHSELEGVTDKLGREARSGIFNVKRHQPRSPRTPTAAPIGWNLALSVRPEPLYNPSRRDYRVLYPTMIAEPDRREFAKPVANLMDTGVSPFPSSCLIATRPRRLKQERHLDAINLDACGDFEHDFAPCLLPTVSEVDDLFGTGSFDSVVQHHRPGRRRHRNKHVVGSSPNKSGDPQQYEEIPDDFKPAENGDIGEATREGLPPGVMYRVRATYRYQKEDVDELSFDVGEIIQVIEFDDTEDQEEGWLMGVKESTGEKGLFPANFTRPI